MAQEKERFLSRWSRLKQSPPREKEPIEAKEQPALPPALPPVESLTPESDFASFMHPKVEDALRRVALKKLFSDPRFNVADPFEAYSGDWTGGEPIPEELLATLNQARSVLFPERKEEEKAPEKEAVPSADKTKPSDEPGRQDT